MSDNKFISLNAVNQLLGFGSSTNEYKTSQYLINNGFGSNAIVYAIINKIATTAVDLPFKVVDQDYETVEDGRVVEAFKEPAIYRGELLNTKEYIENAIVFLLTSGNLYQHKQRLSGFEQTMLEIIPSGIVEPFMPNNYLKPPIKYKVTNRSTQDNIPYDEMSHIKYINPTTNGLMYGVGLSPLQAGLLSLKGSTDIQQALSVMVENQGVRGILTPKNGGMSSDPTILKRFADVIRKKITGVDKVNSVHISNTEVDYLAMGMSVADLKLIESGILTDRQICNLYGLDSKLFNDPSASTFNNITQLSKDLYNNAVIPNVNKILGGFNKDVAKPLEPNQKVVVDTDKIDVLQPDKKVEADKNKANAKAVAEVLGMNTDRSGKISALVNVVGMTIEVATEIVGNGTGTED